MQQLLDPIPSLLGMYIVPDATATRANAKAPGTKDQAIEWGPLCPSGTSSFPSKCKAGGYSCLDENGNGRPHLRNIMLRKIGSDQLEK